MTFTFNHDAEKISNAKLSPDSFVLTESDTILPIFPSYFTGAT